MHHLLKVFLDILQLRKGPQALPASPFLLAMVLTIHFVLGIILFALSLDFARALFAAFLGTALIAALVWVALTLRGFPTRFIQTVTALAGCEVLLTLPTLPFEPWDPKGAGGFASVIALVVMGWSLAVAAHIFHHALSLSPWKGFATGLIYFMILYAVAGLFVGPGN